MSLVQLPKPILALIASKSTTKEQFILFIRIYGLLDIDTDNDFFRIAYSKTYTNIQLTHETLQLVIRHNPWNLYALAQHQIEILNYPIIEAIHRMFPLIPMWSNSLKGGGNCWEIFPTWRGNWETRSFTLDNLRTIDLQNPLNIALIITQWRSLEYNPPINPIVHLKYLKLFICWRACYYNCKKTRLRIRYNKTDKLLENNASITIMYIYKVINMNINKLEHYSITELVNLSVLDLYNKLGILAFRITDMYGCVDPKKYNAMYRITRSHTKSQIIQHMREFGPYNIYIRRKLIFGDENI
jgi:hypothetical protein